MIQSLKDHVFQLAETQSEGAALLSCNQEGETERTYTYRELKEEIAKTASWLQYGLGLAKGDALGLALPNSIELLLLSWSAWALGIVTVPLDMRRDTAKDYEYKLKLAGAKRVVSQEDMKSLTDFKAPQKEISWQNDISHPALVLFTSGTTSKPKGVELSLENLLVNAKSIQEWFDIKTKDRFLVLLPLYHINSTTFSLAALLAGASIAVASGYSNSKFWQQLAKTQSTFTSIVPTICFDQLSREKEFEAVKDQLKITRIQIGSAPVVPHDSQKFIEQFHIPLHQGYGQTETALRVTGVPLDIPKDLYLQLVKENSIGKPMGWAEVEVMDKEGNVLKENEEGEIAVKGNAVMAGYLKDSFATEAAFKNGYFLTGDIGYYKTVDNTRYFFLKGRSKEIIIKGGVNLSPVAIESKLKGLNGNIDQAYVIGLSDERYGEEVGAVVCWKETKKPLEQLEAELKFQLTSPLEELVPYEVPKYIMSLQAKDLPMTSTGKVQRSLLKTTLSKEAFQEVNLVARNDAYDFLRLIKEEKPLLKEALTLYNYCWEPLTLDEKTFLSQVQNGVVLAAVSKKGKVEGLITFLRTSKGEEELRKMTYDQLTDNLTLKSNEKDGDKVVCVSICSASYVRPPSIPKKEDSIVPTPAQMQKYLESGKDLTYNFHKKPKGGILGSELLSLVPQGRPEDPFSLGYNMLMAYPHLGENVVFPDPGSSTAVQLIEAAMSFAKNLGIKKLYVYSRPALAYQYFAKP